jgi:hypothetical protein
LRIGVEMQVFWHRPTESEIKARWHAYDEAGATLCKKFVLMGQGVPKDATTKLPKKERCGACLRKFNGR